MIVALLAAFLTRKPPLVQAVAVGLCVGLFIAASAEANQRHPGLGSTVLLVLVVGVVAGGLFFAGLRTQRRATDRGTESTRWILVVYVVVWVFSIVAAIRALVGNGGLKVAALAIVPIVLLAPTALLGVRVLSGRSAPIDPADEASSAP